jgi:hypothetical protein
MVDIEEAGVRLWTSGTLPPKRFEGLLGRRTQSMDALRLRGRSIGLRNATAVQRLSRQVGLTLPSNSSKTRFPSFCLSC